MSLINLELQLLEKGLQFYVDRYMNSSHHQHFFCVPFRKVTVEDSAIDPSITKYVLQRYLPFT